MDSQQTIAQVAKASGFSVPTLRFYEQEGLIPYVPRDGAGNRRYGETELSRVNTIRCLRTAGLTLPEMKRYFAMVEEGEDTLRVRKEILLSTRERLESQLTELHNSLEYLGAKLSFYRRAIRALERGEEPPRLDAQKLNRCFAQKNKKETSVKSRSKRPTRSK